jgi:hypothetical protein
VLLSLLTGCASGPPMGGRMMFNAMRYRPAMPRESPDTVAARKKARQEREALERVLAQGCPPRDGESPLTLLAATLAPPPRIVLASSSGPTGNGDPFGQATQGYNVPGRNPDSQTPWEFFLGNAAHRLIAYMYGVNHPQNQVFYNNRTILEIVSELRLGDESKLLPAERNLRPDITDATPFDVFEIKPWNDRGTQEGRQEVQLYLSALNRAVEPDASFAHGRNFQGEMLIRFARGQHIWRLEWQTTEPGLVQYRWTRSQQRFESERAAYEAGHWVDISEEEMRQYGGWVGQAVDEMVNRREQLAAFSGAVGICIDVVGSVAVWVFSGIASGKSGAKQPPVQRGGRVIQFPARPPATAPPAKMPAASGM